MGEKKSKDSRNDAALQASSAKGGADTQQAPAGSDTHKVVGSDRAPQKKRKILRIRLQALFEVPANTKIGDEDWYGDSAVRYGRRPYVPIIVFRDMNNPSVSVIVGDPGDKFEWLDYEDDAIGRPPIEEVHPEDPSLNGFPVL